MASLTARLERLEKTASQAEANLVVHWQMDENTQTVECRGVRYDRQASETLSVFLERVTRTLVCLPGKTYWLAAS